MCVVNEIPPTIPSQSKQMLNKQTLMLRVSREETEGKDIIVCTPNNCSYVDDVYFWETMKETNDPKALTYAVKMQSINAHWIVNDEIGLEFL